MKKRWMKTIIETSKEPIPALPFHRSARRRSAPVRVLKVKTA